MGKIDNIPLPFKRFTSDSPGIEKGQHCLLYGYRPHSATLRNYNHMNDILPGFVEERLALLYKINFETVQTAKYVLGCDTDEQLRSLCNNILSALKYIEEHHNPKE